jgi:hypothetical protein
MLRVWRHTREPDHLNCAHDCCDWLLNHPSPRYRNLSWGLPWRWKEWDAGEDVSYSPNSAYAGNLMLEMYDETRDSRYLNAAKSVASWFLEDLKYGEYPDGICFNYSDIEALRFPIYNQNASAAGFMAKLAKATGDAAYEKLSTSAVDFIISRQERNGVWYYSDRARVVDNVHTGFLLDGLCDCSSTLRLPQLAGPLRKGCRAYRRAMFGEDGGAIEQMAVLGRRLNVVHSLRKYNKQRKNPVPAYLWSYGAALRVFSKCDALLDEPEYYKRVGLFVIRNLQGSGGGFKVRTDDGRIFVRHNAHVFDGLANTLERH